MKQILEQTYYQKIIDRVKELAQSSGPWQEDAHAVLTIIEAGLDTTDEALICLNSLEILNKVYVTGLSQSSDFKDAYDSHGITSWADWSAPPVSDDLQIALGKKLYNLNTGFDDHFIIFQLGDQARFVGPWMIDRALEDGIPFVVQFSNSNFSNLIYNFASDEGVQALADDFLDMTRDVNKRILAVSGLPDNPIKGDKDKANIFSSGVSSYMDRVRSGDIHFTLTIIPTPKDAEVDGFEYQDFVELFFEMCDQPWNEINIAQSALIQEFNAARQVHITNNDGTDIAMDIDGFTFANSLIAKNVPGSEIFSAPRRDSVNGTIVAKGRFMHGGEVIEDLTLHFKDGHLESFEAAKGYDAFEAAVSVDEGARYIGELGIGTNPHLKTHVANGLLVEKIGGSFHLALGAAYTMKKYEGVDVNVDNGNESALHWDITTMLYGKEGCIELDGRPIMQDGKFIDPKYDVLNRGWAALSHDKRPAYWQKKLTP